MPIRPIDMQVSIPKMSEVSRMSHLEQQKSGLHQQQSSITADKNTNKMNRTVVQTEADAKAGTDADAKKKGRNEYYAKKKKVPKGTNKKRRAANSGQRNKIDIRV